MPPKSAPVVVVGAGIAGLAAAIALASEGVPVVVIEAADRVGGKIRSCDRDDLAIDVGPTVFTMSWVFEELLEAAGTRLDDEIDLLPLETLAHHRWQDGDTLDLFADQERTLEAIGQFAGPGAAADYRAFCDQAERIYETLRDTFLRRSQPGLFGLIRNNGLARMHTLTGLQPFTTLWRALEARFDDPRLCQLFARYSTYCGSSPFLAPATLMLIAHVERVGVWRLRGGIRALAGTLGRIATGLGADVVCGRRVSRIDAPRRQVASVTLDDGESIDAAAVVLGADKNALAAGLFGPDVRRVAAPTPRGRRSLSAWTWAGWADVDDAKLEFHNVLFSGDYAAEFRQICDERRVPEQPTIYVNLPDTDDNDPRQRIFLLVNAPAEGDQPQTRSSRAPTDYIEQQLDANGIRLPDGLAALEATGPQDFERRFPATGGALYGEAMHGWRAAFERPGCRTDVAGLYLAGGSVHPGAGVPMAALSGRIAAACLLEDRSGRSARSRYS